MFNPFRAVESCTYNRRETDKQKDREKLFQKYFLDFKTNIFTKHPTFFDFLKFFDPSHNYLFIAYLYKVTRNKLMRPTQAKPGRIENIHTKPDFHDRPHT